MWNEIVWKLEAAVNKQCKYILGRHKHTRRKYFEGKQTESIIRLSRKYRYRWEEVCQGNTYDTQTLKRNNRQIKGGWNKKKKKNKYSVSMK